MLYVYFQGEEHLLVKWKGYNLCDATWEPTRNIPQYEHIWNTPKEHHEVLLHYFAQSFEREIQLKLTSQPSSPKLVFNVDLDVIR